MATLNVTIVDGAPGNIITLPGSGLTPGGGANVKLDSQGVTAAPGLTPQTITLPSVFASDGSNVQITIPDGVMDGMLTITAGDASQTTCQLRACSQYVQASEYIGEGTNVTGLTASGELDAILRRASGMIDSYLGDTVRILQVLERPKYRAKRNGPPRIYPYRKRGRRCPIVSVDQLVFVSAKDLVTAFNINDLYVNDSLDYIEILAYAIGNYALLGELEVIGYSANVLELAYTAGYPMRSYPMPIRDATIRTATAFLNRRQRQSGGLGPYKNFRQEVSVDQNALVIPTECKIELRPWVVSALA